MESLTTDLLEGMTTIKHMHRMGTHVPSPKYPFGYRHNCLIELPSATSQNISREKSLKRSKVWEIVSKRRHCEHLIWSRKESEIPDRLMRPQHQKLLISAMTEGLMC